MASDMEKKLKDVQDTIGKKLAEVKELRKLEKAYYIASRLEQRILPKNIPAAESGEKNAEQK